MAQAAAIKQEPESQSAPVSAKAAAGAQTQRKVKPEEITINFVDAFAVMFAALSTILLAFFIMLNTMSKTDSSKQQKALGSLLGSFGALPEGAGFDAKGVYSPTAEVISMGSEQKLFATFEAFVAVDSELPEDVVAVFVDEEGRRRIRFSGGVLFDTGSVRVNPRLMPLMDRLAVMLAELDRPFEVEGHTDEARGRVSNWALSASRARIILRYLQAAAPAGAELRGTAAGFADTRPVASPKGERGVEQRASRAERRRVEIVVN